MYTPRVAGTATQPEGDRPLAAPSTGSDSAPSPTTAAGAEPGAPILFFDGDCGLCHRGVLFLLGRDRRRRLRFAPLQGETAAASLPEQRVRALDTVVLRDEDGLHLRSTAALRALAHCGGPWRAVRVLLAIPAWLRDPLYAFVAARRIAWFGRAETCRPLPAEERSRILP